jgi:hypothetical protein
MSGSHPSEFVGRRTELAVVADAYARVEQARPTALLVAGEAGIGKVAAGRGVPRHCN